MARAAAAILARRVVEARNAMDAVSERAIDGSLLLSPTPVDRGACELSRKVAAGRESIGDSAEPGYMPFLEISRALRSISCFVATTSAAAVWSRVRSTRSSA